MGRGIGLDLTQFSYRPDEIPKKKHHWGEPHAGFVRVRGQLIGKCPATMTIAAAEALLHQGFFAATDLAWPRRVFALGPDGVLYRFAETIPGRSYHGYPVHPSEYHRTLTSAERERIQAAAASLGCEAQLRLWLSKGAP